MSPFPKYRELTSTGKQTYFGKCLCH